MHAVILGCLAVLPLTACGPLEPPNPTTCVPAKPELDCVVPDPWDSSRALGIGPTINNSKSDIYRQLDALCRSECTRVGFISTSRPMPPDIDFSLLQRITAAGGISIFNNSSGRDTMSPHLKNVRRLTGARPGEVLGQLEYIAEGPEQDINFFESLEEAGEIDIYSNVPGNLRSVSLPKLRRAETLLLGGGAIVSFTLGSEFDVVRTRPSRGSVIISGSFSDLRGLSGLRRTQDIEIQSDRLVGLNGLENTWAAFASVQNTPLLGRCELDRLEREMKKVNPAVIVEAVDRRLREETCTP